MIDFKRGMFALFFLVPLLLFSQNKNAIDSLHRFVQTAPPNKKVNALIDLAAAYSDVADYTNSQKSAKEAVVLARTLKSEQSEMNAYYEMGRAEYLDVKYPAALEDYLNSLKLAQKLNNKEKEATCLSGIGMIYYALNDFKKGIEYFNGSISQTKDSDLTASNLAYIAGIYYNLDKYDSAKFFYEKAIVIYQQLHSLSSVVMCQQNVASIYSRTGHLDKAIEVLQETLEGSLKTGAVEDIAYAYFSLGYVYAENNVFDKAILNYKKSLVEFIKANDMAYVSNCHFGLSNAYYSLGDSKNSLEHYRTYIAMRDSTLNIEQAKEITRKELLFQVEKEQLADSLKQELKVREMQIVNNEKMKQQTIYTYAGIFGFLLMMALAIVLLRSNRNKQKANVEIAEQKQKVEFQRDIIEEKQREIIDSINYARRIQRAQLPTESYIDRNLKRLLNTKKDKGL